MLSEPFEPDTTAFVDGVPEHVDETVRGDHVAQEVGADVVLDVFEYGA